MKKLFIAILAVLFCTSMAFGWTISWDALSGSDGYQLSYAPVATQTYTDLDVGTSTSQDLTTIGLVKGTRYEFYVQAYTGNPRSYSGESDHLRWTYPLDPVIVELPEEQSIIINIAK